MNIVASRHDIKPSEPNVAHSIQPSSVTARLSYLAASDQRPVTYAYEPPPGTPWENSTFDFFDTAVVDARLWSQQPTIEHEGFELWDAPTRAVNFLDNDEVRRVYYPELAELARAVTGARHARVFDHLVRQCEQRDAPLNFGRGSSYGRASANGRIHNDYTEASGQRRLELVIPDAAERKTVRRYGVVNIWRSIKAPVLDTPLAVLDARSVDTRDLVVGEVRYPRRTGEIYFLRHSPSHRWAYFPAMDRHEALIFKQYDSQLSGTSRFTPHAAFEHPQAPAHALARESIEARCLVIYE